METNSDLYTITQYQILAEEIFRDIDALAEKIARLDREGAHLSENAIRAYANVPVPFLETAVAVVSQEDELRAVKKLDPDEGMDTLQFLAAFRPVHDRLAVLQRILRRLLTTRRTRLAAAALQIYAIVRSFSRTNPAMADHARNLQRDLGQRGPAKRRRDSTE